MVGRIMVSIVASVRLGPDGNPAWTGRDSRMVASSWYTESENASEVSARQSNPVANMPQLATDIVRVQERGDAGRSLYRRGVSWVSFQPMPDRACGIDFSIRKLPGLGLLSGTVQGIRHEHTREHAGKANDDFSIHINVRGLSVVAGHGREATLRDGDAVLLNYSM